MAPTTTGPESATIWIRLLGPVEATTGRQTMALGGPRLRALFGLLALRAPEVVSRAALIDGIWGGDPPAGVAGTLRAHVAYLRRRLGGTRSGDLITTRAPGYALAVSLEDVDVNQFERDLERGRRAAAAGAFEPAVRHLSAALRLWRGDLLADCATGEWVRAEQARLDQLRLYATEELLAARLCTGPAAAVAAELEGLVQRHPLRERLWELLMLALYRSGRQAEALYAYRRARTLLIEELAVEPGPPLRRLETAILTGDARAIDSTTRAQRLAVLS